MERAKKIIEELRSRPVPPTDQEILNTLREYIQTIVLKLVFESRFGAALSFMGGTALRICHNIKRYSEDLDFALDDRKTPYRFSSLMNAVSRELTLRGFDLATSISEDKVVQKGFFRFEGIGRLFGIRGFHEEQKLHVKLEVDVSPPALEKGDRESFFVNRFQEIFPILKHTLPTLFAGKILAILHRPYARGRDYYDLVWYLSQKVEPNLGYLNRGTRGKKFRNVEEVLERLRRSVEQAKPSVILKDVGRFLEDPSEEKWISDYEKVFAQLTEPYLSPSRHQMGPSKI